MRVPARQLVPVAGLVCLLPGLSACALPARAVASVQPMRPAAMAYDPDGGLYISDPQREQVLRFDLARATFTVVAGAGRAGFAGDGGPARAALLDDPAGLATGPDGTLYVADAGNNRVRAINPEGSITTVVGDGATDWVPDRTVATQAPVSPLALAFGPDARLYLSSAEQVLRLDPDGTLTSVAGHDGPEQGRYGIGGPATTGSVDGADGLALDKAGNLYLAGFATKTLLCVRPDGTLTAPGSDAFYPRGIGSVISSPDRQVYATDGQSVVRLDPAGAHTVVDTDSDGSFAGVRNFLPEGIAVGPDGSLYLDTFDGNGYGDRNAIVRIPPGSTNGELLWSTPAISTD